MYAASGFREFQKLQFSQINKLPNDKIFKNDIFILENLTVTRIVISFMLFKREDEYIFIFNKLLLLEKNIVNRIHDFL